jgi:acetylornithine deacetylase/succinyl-diaminopimelate desuccinylase-like protein
LEDDVLVGRGVLDAKGQIAALITALEAEPDAPAVVVLTCDEESGGLGSQRLDLPDIDRSAGGVVLEPTGFVVCGAQSGCIDLAVHVRGPGGHAHAAAATPSALDALHGALEALETCSFLDARHDLFPPPRLHVGRLQAGEHLWRRPAGALAEVALTLLPGVDAEAAASEVAELGSALRTAWQAAGFDVRLEVADTSAPVEVPSDLPVARRLLAALGDTASLGAMTSWTDAENLLHHQDLACVVFGAGDLASAHSDRESVHLGELVRLAEVLARFLTRR